MITIHDVKQGTDEWHGLRLQYPHTASLAYLLLTKGKNAASNKQGVRSSGFWAERGHILEDEAIKVYEAVYGCDVERPGFITNTDYPDCGWSPDATRMEIRRGIEVKCFKDEKHLACLEEIPTEVYAQCQFGIMVGEMEIFDLVFYNPDIDDPKLCFKVHTMFPDRQLISRFKAKLGLE